MNRHFSLKDIEALDTTKRKNLINSLGGFKSANLIGTTDGKGNHNLAIFNSVAHIGANPPLMGFILRPHTVPRHTYENLQEIPWFTINHVHEGIIEQAHQTGAKYDKTVSEFEATGLTPFFSEACKAPFVKESLIKIGLEYVDEEKIRINNTILIIGKVHEIILPDEVLTEDHFVNAAKANTVAVSGLDGYFSVIPIKRLSYPRTGENLHEINM
jgi:flavin reductase (DIM6/NTAB) family NADH-FMN oxidoreductase RutF